MITKEMLLILNTSHRNNFFPRRTFQGHSAEREYGMSKYARLRPEWNERFFVGPNYPGNTISKNCDSPGRRTFFATPFRNSQGILLVPKKTVDPFIENETKTRIPRYSKLYKERDIGKELNWVDNFSVTFSKNNNNIHRTFKEFFDKPVNYRGAVTVGTSKGVSDIASSKISTNKPTATKHILNHNEIENKVRYSLNRQLKKSLDYNGMIPFLRDHQEKYTLGARAQRKYNREYFKSVANKQINREYGWHKVGYPISKHNVDNHFSKKLKFEDL